jgi:hypothetical protein
VTPRGTVLCPSCNFPLFGFGPRDPLYEAVVEHRGSRKEIMRFPLEVNSPLIVGRGAALKGVNLATRQASFHSAVMQVSRRHLLMRMEEMGAKYRYPGRTEPSELAVSHWPGARNRTDVVY